jgi:hypothetical protein
MAMSTIGVRHGASFNGAGAAAVDIGNPKRLEERIGAGHAAPLRSFRHRALHAKTKLRDGFDLRGAWVHG